jgi:S1-C subfamily serine protease
VRHGKIAYGTIGLVPAELSLPGDVMSKHRLNQGTAIWVEKLVCDGSAKKAGVQEGDWILAIDNRQVESLESFIKILDGELVGRTVTLRVLRGLDHALAEKHVEVVKLDLEGA